MSTDAMKAMLSVLEGQVRQTRAAYASGMKGVEYEDMAAAAKRVLEMRRAVEQATGRTVKTQVTKKAIANLLRSL